jgi:CDP-diacylglycerol--glycerol-3-phosphate 3-phosphatidyltransferase
VRLPAFFLFNESTRRVYRGIISPILRLLIRLHVHPNAVTTAGFVLSMAAGVVYSTGNIYLGGWTVALAGTCDILDGQLSRMTGRSTAFGAFYDSCLDRFSEGFILMGLAWYFAGGPALFWSPNTGHPDGDSPFAVMVIILALMGSFATSYVRARAEAAGIDCTVGRMQRTERFVYLLVASAAGSIPGVGLLLLKMALALYAVLTNVTALQRMVFVGRILLQKPPGGENACRGDGQA